MRKILLATLLAALALPAQAGLFDKNPEDAAAEAARAGMAATTIWIDASWGFRNQGAANSLSKAHNAFARQGYKVQSVEPYIENGDLQGFFVTYQKP
jgi:ABC-type nitrate/sulfonate/bicarbonate transport system substrate-binding protein